MVKIFYLCALILFLDGCARGALRPAHSIDDSGAGIFYDEAGQSHPLLDSAVGQFTSDGKLNIDKSVKPVFDQKVKPDFLTGPCAAGATLTHTFGNVLSLCRSTKAVNQCQAANLCNTARSWTMCTKTQYLARGGASTQSPDSAWIKSCLRRPAVQVPDDYLCPCQWDAATEQYIGEQCDGSSTITYFEGYIGIISSSVCNKLGPSSETAVTGYWDYRASADTSAIYSAVCCN